MALQYSCKMLVTCNSFSIYFCDSRANWNLRPESRGIYQNPPYLYIMLKGVGKFFPRGIIFRRSHIKAVIRTSFCCNLDLSFYLAILNRSNIIKVYISQSIAVKPHTCRYKNTAEEKKHHSSKQSSHHNIGKSSCSEHRHSWQFLRFRHLLLIGFNKSSEKRPEKSKTSRMNLKAM